ncbi:beta-N-acetylhexosaminidase [Wenjunlia tyrosinilytica]|uniref:Hydrolase n=1 Tax=Wenjunlia tyrosinilytica TaxID=1544741 RepID=A0A917ZRS9_9ACTN|nr:beta-N-acetylhexosaminidase [Wenjunlia tyrosinilytica]GGO91684.1 hydrolase [Wenjunlia tyrosinilytica]
MTQELYRLADACILPGFDGITAPDWLLHRIGEGIGGVVLYHANMAGPERLANLTGQLRSANPDLVIGIDEEGGDVTRLHLEHGSPWPGNLALGVVDDCDLTRQAAAGIGAELAAAGINLDLAPVVDVNTAAGNPVIGTRSFGADPQRVAAHSAAHVTGLQSAGVAACAKHFPGHGSTTVDSHHDLPVVHESREEFEATAFPPFRAAIAAEVAAVMTAHILVPAYDTVPATVSRTLLTGVLRDRLGFDGVVITDSLEMQAVYERYGIAGGGVRAIAAGADALCVGTHHGQARTELLRTELVKAVTTGALPQERLAEAATRMAALAARFRSDGPGLGNAAKSARRGAGVPAAALTAARRAVTARAVTPLGAPPLVVEFDTVQSPAIGETAWGLGELLRTQLPGTRVVRVTVEPDSTPASAPADPKASERGRRVVAVVRDVHRHPSVAAALERLLRIRPDTVVVEMGLPHVSPPPPTAFLATHGSSRACAIAAAELLLGRPYRSEL